MNEAGGTTDRQAPLAAPLAERTDRPDGSILLTNPTPLRSVDRCIGDWLVHWAAAAPDRPFLAERPAPGAAWRTISYGETLGRVRRIAGWMLAAGLTPNRPLAILADNGIEHALMALAAMHVGVPVGTPSVAYALMSRDHARLRAMIELLGPGAIYVSDTGPFSPALEAIADVHDAAVVAGRLSDGGPAAMRIEDIEGLPEDPAVDAAFAAVGPDTVARLLFTSGSTGAPKAVITTQRMLTVNQEQRALAWPFLERSPPVIVDWLPWSHTFGASHNLNMILRNGGTLHVDAGKPTADLIGTTIANIKDVAPTFYCSVPRGYDMMLGPLREDRSFRERLFGNAVLLFYAASAMPQTLWDGLLALTAETVGRSLPMVSGWGATETAPLATDCTFQADRSGNIGTPAAGVELKLVPGGGKLEVRVRGPNVTPGYWRNPEQTRAVFDEEGFYLIGDAVRFADPGDPARGLFFDGRVSEDFKLTTGTWVHVGTLRVKAIAALDPVAQDIVVAGADAPEVGFLVFPNFAACRRLAGLDADAPADAVLAHPAVRQRVAEGLAWLKVDGGGTSTYATRALLLATPPSVDAGEITDKGYINQRAVLANRADAVAVLQGHDASAWIGLEPGAGTS